MLRLSAKNLYLAAAGLLVAVGAVVALNVTSTSTQAVGTYRNYSADAIVSGGAITEAELLQHYDANKGDIKNIYTHYGITRDDLTEKNGATIEHGVINRDGTVVVGGKTVATGAYSLSRKPFNDAQGNQPRQVKINGTTYYEGPNMSIFVKQVDAYIIMKNGKFHRAIISSCANPAVATPPKEPEPTPLYACESLKADKIGDLRYKFITTASASNGARIANYTYDFGDGTPTIVGGASREHSYAKAGTYTAKVTVNVKVGEKVFASNSEKCKYTVKIEDKPVTPIHECKSLTATPVSKLEYKFNVSATASNGAVVDSYTFNFGDGKSESTKNNQINHTYEKPGTYNAFVAVTYKVNGQNKTLNDEKCKVTVKIEEETTQPKPSIDIVKTVNSKEHAKVAVSTQFTYEITVRNTGDVVLKDAVVTDKAPKEVTLVSADMGTINGNDWTYTIPELKVGESKSFIITAKYATYASGTHKNTVCVETPTVPGNPDDCDDATTETKEPIQICDLNDNTVKTIEKTQFNEATMTTDITRCGNIEVCIIEDKTIKVIARNEYNDATMTTDLSKCEDTPPELPQTGLDMFIGGSLGVGSITAASYYWLASRRNLLSVMLNK